MILSPFPKENEGNYLISHLDQCIPEVRGWGEKLTWGEKDLQILSI
jgi:hypothetical protein